MRIPHDQRTAFVRHLSVQSIRRVVPMAFEAAASRFEGHHHAELIRHANIMRALPTNVDPDAAAAALRAADAADAADAARWAAAAALRADAHHVRDEYAACLLEASDACLSPGSIPINTEIDQRVFEFITTECRGLDMYSWHGDESPENWCGTTHCRAGAAVACQGQQGIELEQAFGSSTAGALIYSASYRAAGKPVTIPDFYAGNDEAMGEMKQLAALEGGAQ